MSLFTKGFCKKPSKLLAMLRLRCLWPAMLTAQASTQRAQRLTYKFAFFYLISLRVLKSFRNFRKPKFELILFERHIEDMSLL